MTEETTQEVTSSEDGKNSEPVEKIETETTLESGKNSEVSPKFTQEEVNKLMGDIRKKSREKGSKEAVDNLLGQVGVPSVDDLLGIVAEHQTLKEQSMSEQERINAELEALREKSAALEAENAQVYNEVQTEKIKSAVVSAAAGRFESPEAAYQLLGEDDGITISDGGEVEGVEEALNALLEKYPFLGKKSATSRTSTANPEDPTKSKGKTDEQRKKEYFGMNPGGFFQGRGVRRVEISEE